MCSVDKDFRFMATNDLIGELQKGSIKLDDETEKRVMEVTLNLLEDKNTEVRNLAIRCLGVLINKLKPYLVENIVETLCNCMQKSDSELKDISSIALKTIINEFPLGNTYIFIPSICRKIAAELIKFISKEDDMTLQLEALEILATLLEKYASFVASLHENIQQIIMPQLISSRLAVRKRSMIVLSLLMGSSSESIFNKIFQKLIEQVHTNTNISYTRTYIQCIGLLSKYAGNRVASFLPSMIPCFLENCQKSQFDEEIVEHCLTAFNNLILSCPVSMRVYVEQISELCLRFLSFDPNYNYDEEEEEINLKSTGNATVNNLKKTPSYEDSMDLDYDEKQIFGEEEDNALSDDDEVDELKNSEDDDYVEDEEDDDDDDLSWKLRRVSIKCLESILITFKPEILTFFYNKIALNLIKRFKEREENVKVDILQLYKTLISCSRLTVKKTLMPNTYEKSNSVALKHITTYSTLIVKALKPILRGRQVKAVSSGISLLSEIINFQADSLMMASNVLTNSLIYSIKHFRSIFKYVLKLFHSCLSLCYLDDSYLKIEVLSFFTLCFEKKFSFSPDTIKKIFAVMISSIEDSFYKISSQALTLATTFTVYLHENIKCVKDCLRKTFVSTLLQSISPFLKINDIEQVLRENALLCLGYLCHYFFIEIESNSSFIFSTLTSKLNNEVTRLAAVKTMNLIATSTSEKINAYISSLMGEYIEIISSFLRKNQRRLRLESLSTLAVLLKSNSIDSTIYNSLFSTFNEVPSLLCDNDIKMCQLSVELMTVIVHSTKDLPFLHFFIFNSSGQHNITSTNVMSRIYSLLTSPLFQENTLLTFTDFLALLTKRLTSIALTSEHTESCDIALIKFLSQIVDNNQSRASFQDSSLHIEKINFLNVSKCVAAIILSNEEKSKVYDYVRNLIISISTSLLSQNDSYCLNAYFSLLLLGNIGKFMDLSSFHSEIKNTINLTLQQQQKQTYFLFALSYALANVCIGNLEVFFPLILNEIQASQLNFSFIFQSLKEVIGNVSSSKDRAAVSYLHQYLTVLTNSLFTHATSFSQDGTCQLISECLGKLTLLFPQELFAQLFERCKTSNETDIKATVISALSYSISDVQSDNEVFDSLLCQHFPDFLSMVNDEDLNVVRLCLTALNAVAHHKPALLSTQLLSSYLSDVYSRTKVRTELIQEVEMGPFKHAVDKGLDVRKAAFEYMYSLLECCLDKLDISQYMLHFIAALRDHYDIKMLAHLILIRLANISPPSIIPYLEKCLDALKETCSSKVKMNSVKQEHEKQDELKRSALRVYFSLVSVPVLEKQPSMNTFLIMIKSNEELNSMYDTIKGENLNLPGIAIKI